ncbi:MAG: N-acetyl-1-D-myo-inositol-2-amino-2-deoxy-alpha-D-glucopyranoside deacetylase [Actinomycetota bacterium]
MTGSLAVAAAPGRARLLFVHAHPDDETLTTGITMAAYAGLGHDVHLLTCTLGEEGEVIPPELAHLGSAGDDTLGTRRREELRAAMALLGVEHSVLGEDPARGTASRYRDSGMADSANAQHPDAFALADVDEAAVMVATHIRTLRPDVVVTYDQQGGYAHPDHIQTHRVTMSALMALSGENERDSEVEAGSGAATASPAKGAAVPAVYCILTPQSWATQDRGWLLDRVASIDSNHTVLQQNAPYPPSVVDDEVVTHVVDEPALAETQSRALAEHKTQVTVCGGYYVLSNHIATRLSGREGFARFDPVAGRLVPGVPGAPRHTDLLTGFQDPG